MCELEQERGDTDMVIIGITEASGEEKFSVVVVNCCFLEPAG